MVRWTRTQDCNLPCPGAMLIFSVLFQFNCTTAETMLYVLLNRNHSTATFNVNGSLFKQKTMWDSDADKYWKEKQKNQRRVKLQAIAIGLFLVIGLWSVYVQFIKAELDSHPLINATEGEILYAPDVLMGCRTSCRELVTAKCNNICRFTHAELPRPSVHRACQGPCVKIGLQSCEVATLESEAKRSSCRQEGQQLSYSTCLDYQNALPKPRMHQVCNIGTKVWEYTCQTVSKCLQDS